MEPNTGNTASLAAGGDIENAVVASRPVGIGAQEARRLPSGATCQVAPKGAILVSGCPGFGRSDRCDELDASRRSHAKNEVCTPSVGKDVPSPGHHLYETR